MQVAREAFKALVHKVVFKICDGKDSLLALSFLSIENGFVQKFDFTDTSRFCRGHGSSHISNAVVKNIGSACCTGVMQKNVLLTRPILVIKIKVPVFERELIKENILGVANRCYIFRKVSRVPGN